MHEELIDSKEKSQGRGGQFHSELFEWGEALVISLTVIILLFTFVVRLIGVDGSSMFPTLHDRDKVFMSNLFYSPKKGDIVVLTKQSFIEGAIVKRIIATEGDTIDINFSENKVYIDGESIEEPYVNPADLGSELRAGDTDFPQIVPENCVFVMGDNRNGSSDSRISSLGMVDKRYILGHVLMRIMPFNRIGGIR